ncbi:hypothetical protein WB401_10945 [Streptomyces brasiliscabiei]|uniref:Secreted protein n=1 Tax=Streptomyces brasiliscabiei TaxID=2736302 RepID=A0ABU8GT06_9ACTN
MSGRFLRLVGTATVTALTAGALIGTPPALAAPDPGTRSVAGLLTDLRRLYREAEEAEGAYTATGDALTRQRAEVTRLDRRLAAARLSLHDSRGAAGRLARQQYQSGSTALSPYVRLLMARDPHRALEQGHVIGQVARERAETIERLTGSAHDTDTLARRARAALDRQLTLAEQHRRHHDTASDRLDEIEELLASLTPDQLTAVRKSEETTGAPPLQGRGELRGQPSPDPHPPTKPAPPTR